MSIREKEIKESEQQLSLHRQTDGAYRAWCDRRSRVQMSVDGLSWHDVHDPVWLSEVHYRIKPQPKLRPWTKDEARGKWIHDKINDIQSKIVSVGGTYLYTVAAGNHTPQWYLENCTQLDGSPCGVYE